MTLSSVLESNHLMSAAGRHLVNAEDCALFRLKLSWEFNSCLVADKEQHPLKEAQPSKWVEALQLSVLVGMAVSSLVPLI